MKGSNLIGVFVGRISAAQSAVAASHKDCLIDHRVLTACGCVGGWRFAYPPYKPIALIIYPDNSEYVMLGHWPNEFQRRRPIIAITRRSVAVGIGLIVLSAVTAGHAIADGEKRSITTAVSSISWGPGPHIRVYRSNGDQVTEKAWDGNGPWYTGAFNVPGQTVTATSWLDPAIHIRVYVIDGGAIMEYCWDGGGPWYKGGQRL